jgi:hypothetical protein
MYSVLIQLFYVYSFDCKFLSSHIIVHMLPVDFRSHTTSCTEPEQDKLQTFVYMNQPFLGRVTFCSLTNDNY